MKKEKIKLIIGLIIFIGAICLIAYLYYGNKNFEELEEEATEVGIIKINDDNFEDEVLKSPKPVVLEFYSNSCPPCISMLPTMIDIAKNDNFRVGTINSDEKDSLNTKNKYNIEATPTIIIFKDGEEIKTFVGATSKENIMKVLEDK